MSADDLPEHVRRNRATWDVWAAQYVGPGERNWETSEATWGIWGVPESQLRMLDDVAGRDVIELGCGTAYVSAWLARRGARPVGIDNSEAQLATARRLQAQHGLAFPLLHGNAESVPYPHASFDVAISEYGACLWADPYRWIPEAARLLRPGGRLVFLTTGVLALLCLPDTVDGKVGRELLRPSFGLHRVAWTTDPGVEFHLTHGDWLRLLRANGFVVDELIEVQPPETATTRYTFADLDWARRWPSEEVWKATKIA